MGLVILSVRPNHFSKELLKYIFYEGVECIIKSWDIIYSSPSSSEPLSLPSSSEACGDGDGDGEGEGDAVKPPIITCRHAIQPTQVFT